MANIKIDQVIEYVEKIKKLRSGKRSGPQKILIMQFQKKQQEEMIVDEELASETLHLKSRNGTVAINFDESGLIVNVTVKSITSRIVKQCLVEDVTIEHIQKYTDRLENWLEVGESPAGECLVIQFEKGEEVPKEPSKSLSAKDINVDIKNINDYLINNTLYLQSRNGNVSIDFDESGFILGIEIV